MWTVGLDEILREFYAPKFDPKGQWSSALVVFMPNIGRTPHLEVLASWGAGYNYADDCDGNSLRESWAQVLQDDGFTEGLYVIEASWTGSSEDTDFEIMEIRPLNQEEKDCVSDNSDFSSVEKLWRLPWSHVPCIHCGKGYAEHVESRALCPVQKPPEEMTLLQTSTFVKK